MYRAEQLHGRFHHARWNARLYGLRLVCYTCDSMLPARSTMSGGTCSGRTSFGNTLPAKQGLGQANRHPPTPPRDPAAELYLRSFRLAECPPCPVVRVFKSGTLPRVRAREGKIWRRIGEGGAGE